MQKKLIGAFTFKLAMYCTEEIIEQGLRGTVSFDWEKFA